MELAIQTLFPGLTLHHRKLVKEKHTVDFFTPNLPSSSQSFPCPMRYRRRGYSRGYNSRCVCHVFAVPSVAEDVGLSSATFEDFTVMTSTNKSGELEMSVEVSGARTRAVFDDVFDKMVAAAQPIPGFRRVKGGKTPDIPRDILLEVLGPSKVYKEVIKKVINSTVSEYVEKECLKVRKDLRVEQSFEDLEDAFEPDEKFSFDAVVQLQEAN